MAPPLAAAAATGCGCGSGHADGNAAYPRAPRCLTRLHSLDAGHAAALAAWPAGPEALQEGDGSVAFAADPHARDASPLLDRTPSEGSLPLAAPPPAALAAAAAVTAAAGHVAREEQHAPLAAGAAAADSRTPLFHVMPRSGWGSDPNGPIFYKGRYHQWYWGMCWDHVVSNDLATWERLPPALVPTPGGTDADG